MIPYHEPLMTPGKGLDLDTPLEFDGKVFMSVECIRPLRWGRDDFVVKGIPIGSEKWEIFILAFDPMTRKACAVAKFVTDRSQLHVV